MAGIKVMATASDLTRTSRDRGFFIDQFMAEEMIFDADDTGDSKVSVDNLIATIEMVEHEEAADEFDYQRWNRTSVGSANFDNPEDITVAGDSPKKMPSRQFLAENRVSRARMRMQQIREDIVSADSIPSPHSSVLVATGSSSTNLHVRAESIEAV